MPQFYRQLKTFTGRLFYWALDYLYAGKWEVSSVLNRSSPLTYRNDRVSDRPVIILIPGIYENWYFMTPIAKLLYDAGYDVRFVDGLNYNMLIIESAAAMVDSYIKCQKLTDCIIVAHSKGGLIGKYLLANLPSSRSVRRLIAINTPFVGSRYAYLSPVKSIRIFRPNSRQISGLIANKIINKHVVSIYSQFDPHIPEGSYLEGAHNITVDAIGHFRPLADPDVHKEIMRVVDGSVRR